MALRLLCCLAAVVVFLWLLRLTTAEPHGDIYNSDCRTTELQYFGAEGDDLEIGQNFNPGVNRVVFKWSVEQPLQKGRYVEIGASNFSKQMVEEKCDLIWPFGPKLTGCSDTLKIQDLALTDSGCYRRDFYYDDTKESSGGYGNVHFFIMMNVTVLRLKPVLVPVKLNIKQGNLSLHCLDANNPDVSTFMKYSPVYPENSIQFNVTKWEGRKFSFLTAKSGHYSSFVNVQCCSELPPSKLNGNASRVIRCGREANIELSQCYTKSLEKCFEQDSRLMPSYYFRPVSTFRVKRMDICHASRSQCGSDIHACVNTSVSILSDLTGWGRRPSSWVKMMSEYEHINLGTNRTCSPLEKVSRCGKFLTLNHLTVADSGLYASQVRGIREEAHVTVVPPLNVYLQLVNLTADTVTLNCSISNYTEEAVVRWFHTDLHGFANEGGDLREGEPGVPRTFNLGCADGVRSISARKFYCIAETNSWYGSSPVLVIKGSQPKCTHKADY